MIARVLAAAVIVALTAASAQATDKVRLRLDWVFGSEHAPIFLAKQKGFFSAEDIDVDLLAGEGSTVTVKLVGNRTAEFGYAAADQSLMAFSRELPVVATAVILQKSPSAIIYPTSLGIKSLTDLYGRKLGVQLRSNTEKQWLAVAKINKIDRSKITEVPADRAIAQLIESQTIDAGVAFFFNDGLKVISDGIPMEWTLFADVGLPIYSTSLVTHADLIKENRDLVARFTRAFVKGWTYALANPDETLEVFLKENPTIDPRYSAMKLPEVLKLTQTDDTRRGGIGHSTKENWEAMQNALVDMGLMAAKLDVAQVFTNDFVK